MLANVVIAVLAVVAVISICVSYSLEMVGRTTARELRLSQEHTSALDAQIKLLAEQLVSFQEMKTQQDVIAIWLRENCKHQIAMGMHHGRGLGESVVGYLVAPSQITADTWCRNCNFVAVAQQGDTCGVCAQLLAKFAHE